MERIELFPIFDRFTMYNDHYAGELPSLGDALGRDCVIEAFDPENVTFAAPFRGDGSKNEDWYSWNAKVYAPISGKVVKVYINEVTNLPGQQNPSPASMIVLQREDGVTVVLAHIQNPLVQAGDQVTEGQHIAYVGNNGYARNPHIHIGAFRGETPLMIGFDAEKVGQMRERVEECYWMFGISDEEYIRRYRK